MLLVAALAASATPTLLNGQLSAQDRASGASIADECHSADDLDATLSRQTSRSASAAEPLRICADALSHEGSWKKAEQFYESALAVDRQAENGPAAALDIAGIGHSELRLGYPLKAEEYYQQALAVQQKISPNSLAMARSLNGLGEVKQKWGDVVQAERYFRQAQVILKKLGHQGELDFAVSLNGLGGAAQQLGLLVKAEVLHRRALSIHERLSTHGLGIADTLDYLGRLAYLHSHYQEAEDYYNKALALRKQFADGGLDTVWSIVGLGNVAFDRGELAKAKETYRHALSISEQFVKDSLVTGKILGNLSLVSFSEGDLAAAETYQRQALTVQSRLAPYGLDVATSLRNLGDIFDRRGDLVKADEYCRQSLAIRQRLIPGSPGVASSLSKLGVIANRRGDLIHAEEYYLQSLEIRKKLNPSGLEVARSFHALGALAQQRRDLARAEKYYRQALTIEEKNVPRSLQVANSLVYLSLLEDDRGDQARAEHYCRKALAIKQRIVPDSIDLAGNMSVLGQIRFDRGDLDQAESYLQKALVIQRRSNPGSLQVASSLHFLGLIAHARGHLFSAENLEREALSIQEKLAPATLSHAEMLASLAAIVRDENRWDSSAQLYQRSLEALENFLTRFGGGNELRTRLRARQTHIPEEYASLLMQQRQSRLAFEVSERWRARSLLEMLTEARIDIRKGVDPQLLEREHWLQRALAAKSNSRIQLLARTPKQQQLAAADQEIDELSRQYQELQERIRQKSPEYAALTNPKTLTISDVQQLLGEGNILLEYSLGKERSFLWAVSSESFSAYELPNRTEIERLARRVYQLLIVPGQIIAGETQSQRRARLEKAQRAYWKTSASLSRMILGPASAQIKDRRLLIVTDGALQYIPFAALPEPDVADTDSETVNPPLIVQHEIASLPSATALSLLRERAVRHKEFTDEVVVLADAVFSKEDTRVKKEDTHQNGKLIAISSVQVKTNFLADNRTARLVSSPRLPGRGGIYLTRLPFSREEAKAIMAVTPAGKGIAWLDFAANLDLATSPRLAQYRIVHFATHGMLDNKNPELSGLIFSTVNREGKPQNGFLNLQRIYNLKLPVDLVVLSACETALGKEVKGEGLIGLTRGFMYAGALHVIASLWKIDDARTAELMKYFYKGMEQENLTPGAALRKAQIYAWTKAPRGLPFYWAAFEVHGD
jgi:CHAT domain-containing protein/Tfp pilus assembly protein PilF